MTKKEKYLVALDVGSTKTCAVISELTEMGAKFVAMGAAESKGLRKGLIANIGAAATSVRRAIEEAETVAGTRETAAQGASDQPFVTYQTMILLEFTKDIRQMEPDESSSANSTSSEAFSGLRMPERSGD